MADGWLEDDRFGTLEDILKRTNHEVMKKGRYHFNFNEDYKR